MGTIDFGAGGASTAARLAQGLEQAGPELRRRVAEAMRRASKPMETAVRTSAARGLPRRGGLSDRGGQLPVRAKVTQRGGSASLSIVVQGTKATIVEVQKLDNGNLRHPLFGNRHRWYGQRVRPKLLSRPIEKLTSGVVAEIERAVEQVLGDIPSS